MQLTLPNGILLDNEYGMAKVMNDYARKMVGENCIIFHSKQNDYQSYVMFLDGNPYRESQVAEELAACIDMLALEIKFRGSDV